MARETKARIPTAAEIRRVTKRGVQWIITEDEFVAKLKSGRRLRLKMGFDPTAPAITLGWAVGLRKLRQLQDLGHTVVVIIGDWTARIGDPSGQSQTRKMLSTREVRANAQKILGQFYKILDRKRTEVRWQREWYDNFRLTKLATLASHVTVSKMLGRDDFWKRFQAERPIHIQEFIYPLLQAYDSVAVSADVEFGGTDQEFNILLGRELQPKYNQPAQCAFLMPLLVGLDGQQKMSQSLGNYIAVDDSPSEMYGKIMSLPDGAIVEYFELLTDVPERELIGIRNAIAHRTENPMKFKMRLGREIVSEFHTKALAREAEKDFELTFRSRTLARTGTVRRPVPKGTVTVSVSFKGKDSKVEALPPLLRRSGIVASASDARRLINEGAVREVGSGAASGRYLVRHTPKAARSSRVVVSPGTVYRVGKHRFLRIVDADKQP